MLKDQNLYSPVDYFLGLKDWQIPQNKIGLMKILQLIFVLV